jgi:hypothetical protein
MPDPAPERAFGLTTGAAGKLPVVGRVPGAPPATERRHVMPRQPRELPEWMRRLEAIKQCRTSAELLARHGEPAHKLEDPALEIWHYPLGIAGGTLYSIHVAVAGDDAPTAYLHVEPTSEPDTVAPRPWWRFW